MSDIAIKVEGLSKQYRIGERESYQALRDVITDAASAPFRRLQSAFGNGLGRNGNGHEIRNPQSEIRNSFWALDDVSFEVKRGEVVGIIGRNGAGKSTLLKILSRITKPTRGHATIHGRVGSLLEVGTGFHPELTGRENIYLNAAILGMRKAEVAKKFDEIVAFAEVERFIDTPVKRYSSGMYVRLAFAVAAHMETEVLLVDEVLAVGDAEFQKKCLGKISHVASEGRTILFVSHNMGSVNRLCQSVVWLKSGRLHHIGNTEHVVSKYLSDNYSGAGERSWDCLESAPGNGKMKLRCVRVLNRVGIVSTTIDIQQPFYVELRYDVLIDLPVARVNFSMVAGDGTIVFTSSDINDHDWEGKSRRPGSYVSRCKIPGNLLNSGAYTLTVGADIPLVEVLFLEEQVIGVEVEPTGGVCRHYSERWAGVVCPDLTWNISFE